MSTTSGRGSPRPRLPDVLRPWQRFHVRLTALYGTVVFLVLTAMAGFFYLRGVESELHGLQGRLRVGAVALASGIDPGLVKALRSPADHALPAHRQLLQRFQAVTKAEPDISSIYVLRLGDRPGTLKFVADHVTRGTAKPALAGQEYDATRSDRLLDGFEAPTVQDEPYTDEWGTVFSGYAPIRDDDGAPLAVVGVDVQVSRLEAMKADVRRVAFGLYVLAALALGCIAAVVARHVREPLDRIVLATSAIAAGRFQVRAELHRSDEFGVVGRHFDGMASGLEEREFIKSTFGSYVSPELVRRLLAQKRGAMAGQRRRVVVLFSDIRGFTNLSENLAPEEVVAILNDYLERMTLVIGSRQGRVDKFIGDAIMADWGALEETEDRESLAVDSAVEMLRALQSFNAERAARGLPALRIGIGLNAGEVVAGSIGSQRKLEFTIIGDTVNVASRLEGLCKLYGAGIVASRAVLDTARTPHARRRLDRAVVAGRAEPTDLFEVLDLRDPRAGRCAVYERGMDAFYAQRWDDAIAAFDEASQDLDDPVAAFQIERCLALRAAPPPADWDGVAHRSK